MNEVEVYIQADNTEEVKEEMKARVRRALNAMGIQAATLARMEIQNDPSRIDTGLLRNSITHALDGEGMAIGTYSPDRPSKYDGKTPEDGHYSGTMPREPEGSDAVYIGTNVEYAA